MKKILSLLLGVALLTGCFGMGANAEVLVQPKVSHTYTATEEFARDEWFTDQRGAYLGNGVSVISREGVNMISISGSTNATRYCDQVRLVLFVERSTSYATGYGTYKMYSYSANNAYQLGKEISNIPIERGYYYRVRGVHSVTENGVIESTDSITDPLDYR